MVDGHECPVDNASTINITNLSNATDHSHIIIVMDGDGELVGK